MREARARTRVGPGWLLTALALSGGLVLTSCASGEDEPNPAEIPSLAAVEVEPGAIEIEAGEIELKLADLDVEAVLPFDEDDAGKTVMASGYVIGRALAGGFFLLTQDSRVLFVESTEAVMPGDIVRAAGSLQAVATPVFQGWELEAFEGGVEAEWDLQRALYLDASVVEVYRRVNPEQATRAAPGAQARPDTTPPAER